MPNSEDERFARLLLGRLNPAQRRTYREKQAKAARLRQIVDAIESDDDDSELTEITPTMRSRPQRVGTTKSKIRDNN